MNQSIGKRSRWKQAILALLIVLFGAWSANELCMRFPTRSHPMNEYTQHLKTVCVGRYLWDVPQQAVVPPLSQVINGIIIRRLPDDVKTSPLFSLKIEQRQRAIREKWGEQYYRFLKEAPLSSDNQKIFMYLRGKENDGLIRFFGYVWLGTGVYELEFEKMAEDFDSGIKKFTTFVSTLRPRPNDEILTTPGVCIDGAFAAGKAFEDESVGADFKLPGFPGFSMLLAITPGSEPDKKAKLIERVTRNWTLGGDLGVISIQRKAAIALLEQPGEELMFSLDDKDTQSVSAQAEIYGDGTIARQGLIFKMSNDSHDEMKKPFPAVLPDEKAKAIWDVMLKTVRLRPGAI